MLKEKSSKVKKQLIKALNILSEKHPERMIKQIHDILQWILHDDDNSVRIAAIKMLYPISKSSKKTEIPIEHIISLLNDPDSLIKESAIIIMGNIGSVGNYFEAVFVLLKELLKDKNWSIRNAALKTLYQLAVKSGDENSFNRIIELLDDKEKFTQLKALEIITDMAKDYPEKITLNKIRLLIKNQKDNDILMQVAKLIGNLSSDLFDNVYPLILELMIHPDKDVRDKASNALVTISSKIPMNTLLPETLKYFSDETNILLQESMAIALKRIIKYESSDIKKRVYDILKMRCEISQNPIICQVMQELKE